MMKFKKIISYDPVIFGTYVVDSDKTHTHTHTQSDKNNSCYTCAEG